MFIVCINHIWKFYLYPGLCLLFPVSDWNPSLNGETMKGKNVNNSIQEAAGYLCESYVG